MQYLLTEDEYRAMQNAADERRLAENEKLAALCKLAAMHVPVASGWMKGKPWGCPHVPESREEYNAHRYAWALAHGDPGECRTCFCDHCPAHDVCPLPKDWSK
jgi:hypothetical protein